MVTGRSIDHVVLTVRDLDRAALVFEALGFTLTPRASHEDRMGTVNRLAQFHGKNFIELLEVDRPDTLAPHSFADEPPAFSFGAHNRDFIQRGEGMSMLVFASDDAIADSAGFAASGLRHYAPFAFERLAVLPDGQSVTVAFSLAFVTSPEMPSIAFFACHNKASEHFWKPAYQNHANGASGIVKVYLASPDPSRDGDFLCKLFTADSTLIEGGIRVACGPVQSIDILTPEAMVGRDPTFTYDSTGGSAFAGIALATSQPLATLPSNRACGLFIEWVVS